MTNMEKYTEAFVNALKVSRDSIEEIEYQKVEGWDSVGHMNLISDLEETFDIMFDTDDILAFNSFKAGIAIIKKYGVEM